MSIVEPIVWAVFGVATGLELYAKLEADIMREAEESRWVSWPLVALPILMNWSLYLVANLIGLDEIGMPGFPCSVKLDGFRIL